MCRGGGLKLRFAGERPREVRIIGLDAAECEFQADGAVRRVAGLDAGGQGRAPLPPILSPPYCPRLIRYPIRHSNPF
jgi:hypothetical protein